MNKKKVRLGTTQYQVLKKIRDLRPELRYGAEITRILSEERNCDVYPAIVYTVLAKLLQKHLVSSSLSETPNQHGGIRRKMYAIEQLGNQALHEYESNSEINQ